MEVNLDFRDKSAARILSLSALLSFSRNIIRISASLCAVANCDFITRQLYGAIRAVTKVSRVISRLCDLENHVRDVPQFVSVYGDFLVYLRYTRFSDKNTEELRKPSKRNFYLGMLRIKFTLSLCEY